MHNLQGLEIRKKVTSSDTVSDVIFQTHLFYLQFEETNIENLLLFNSFE